ncbi:MAG: rRNA maturation RNase YbeY [Phycisphaeraceae bacterium]|nr:rRNA maturation RNase YbeY [Phycisphaeraceae bacterium]
MTEADRVLTGVVGACVEAEVRAWLADRISAVIPHLVAPDGSPVRVARVSVRIVPDPEMIRLHVEAMGEATPTDVLSWVTEGERGGVEVDLALGADEAVRQALIRSHAPREELLLYAVHGLLHAAGFDDRAQEDFIRMHAEEARLLGVVGGAARVESAESPASGPQGPAGGGERRW